MPLSVAPTFPHPSTLYKRSPFEALTPTPTKTTPSEKRCSSRPIPYINPQREPTPPAPELEAEPGQSLQPYMAAEQRKLNTYRWVDRQAGIAAMPIDRAIDAVAQQGLPARPGPPAGVHDAARESPSSASSGRVDEAYP